MRLLKLRHADNPNSGIICNLPDISLKKKKGLQRYEALSRTWNLDGLNRTAVIDQGGKAYVHEIPISLFQALKILRETRIPYHLDRRNLHQSGRSRREESSNTEDTLFTEKQTMYVYNSATLAKMVI